MTGLDKKENTGYKFLGGNKQKKKVKICFTIPTYKRSDFLRTAIDSIVSQRTFGLSYHVVVLSNDPQFEASDLIAFYSNKPVAFYRNEENIGLAGNWNRCFELVHAEYVSMLHDDDFLLDNYFQVISRILHKKENKKYSLFVPKRYIWNQDGMIKKPGVLHSVLMGMLWFRCLWKKELQEIYPEQYYDTMTSLYQAPSCGTIFNYKDFVEYGGFWDDYPYADFDSATFIDFNRTYRAAMIERRVGVARSNEGGLSTKTAVKASLYENALYMLNKEKKLGENHFATKYYNEMKRFYFNSNDEEVRKMVSRKGIDIGFEKNNVKYIIFRVRTRLYLYLHNLDIVEIVSKNPAGE